MVERATRKKKAAVELSSANPAAQKVPLQHYLGSLSQEQQAAVTAPLGATRVVAGPGSGKTRVLISRIAHLLNHHQVPAYQVLAITFTNKAGGEMRERLGRLLGEEAANGLAAGTFHSFCYRLLKRELHLLPGAKLDRDFTLYDEDMSAAVVRRLVAEDHSHDSWPQAVVRKEADSIHSCISSAKSRMVTWYGLKGEAGMLKYFQTQLGTATLPAVLCQKAADMGSYFDRYQEELAKNNVVDFDDLLALAVALFLRVPDVLQRWQSRFRHLLVDEFQDTNAAQYELVKLLAGDTSLGTLRDSSLPPVPAAAAKRQRSLFVVGDPDQAIYGWRGAVTNSMHTMFSKDFPHAQELFLVDNYRSAACILDPAQRLINFNDNWERRQLNPKRPRQDFVQLHVAADDHAEASLLGALIQPLVAGKARAPFPPEEIAVLYRTHAQSRLIEQEMVKRGIPYVLVGGTPFWRRVEIQDVIAYLRLAVTLRDDVALARIFNVPKRKLGDTSYLRVKEYAQGLGITMSQLLFGTVAEQTTSQPSLPELPSHKELGLTSTAYEQLRAFRQAVWDMREAVLEMPLPKALTTCMALVKYEEYVAGGGCSSSKEDKVADRLARLQQLLAAAEEYRPGALGGLSPTLGAELDLEEGMHSTAGSGEGAGHAVGVGASAASAAASSEGERMSGSRGDGLVWTRSFLDEAALYSSAEEGVAAKGVRLMTLHAAKGLEFEAVFIAGCNDHRLPSVWGDEYNHAEKVREERRLFYVGITRAKQRLALVHSREQSMFGQEGRKENEPSRFLFEAFDEKGLKLMRESSRMDSSAGSVQQGQRWQRRQGQQARQQRRRPPGQQLGRAVGSTSSGRSQAAATAREWASPAPRHRSGHKDAGQAQRQQ
ncbi:hypothetical protein N2152v2_007292 [Parachlorella kessleri]